MKKFTSDKSFEIHGRGTVHVAHSPAGEDIPVDGEIVEFNGEERTVIAVEKYALPLEILRQRNTPIGLLLRPKEEKNTS